MYFHKMVFYLKDAYAKIRCGHAPLHIFMYSVTKNDEVNIWLQEIHVDNTIYKLWNTSRGETISWQITFQD